MDHVSLTWWQEPLRPPFAAATWMSLIFLKPGSSVFLPPWHSPWLPLCRLDELLADPKGSSPVFASLSAAYVHSSPSYTKPLISIWKKTHISSQPAHSSSCLWASAHHSRFSSEGMLPSWLPTLLELTFSFVLFPWHCSECIFLVCFY